MKRLVEQIVTISVLTLVFSIFCSGNALAWGPITHQYINSQTSMFYTSPYQSYYLTGAISPDIFYRLVPQIKQAHSPELSPGNGSYPYYDKPNFAYLMLKVRGMDAAESRFFAYAMSWSGHISSDWVAHGTEFPIIEDWRTNPVLFAHHTRGEALYDSYVFFCHPSLCPIYRFNYQQIRKTFVNYELIQKHKENSNLPDDEIANAARNSAPSIQTIKEKCRNESALAYAIQAALLYKSATTSPVEIISFLGQMRVSGAEDKLDESIAVADQWMANPAPYAGIPSRYLPEAIKNQSAQTNPVSRNNQGIANAPLLASEVITPEILAESLDLQSGETPDDITHMFWEDVVTRCQANGSLICDVAETVDENGELILEVTPTITDQSAFIETLNQTIYDHLNNPTSEADKSFANFQKNLFIESILDVDTLMDSTAPVIGNVTPIDGSLAVGAAPTISVIVEDLPGLEAASGVDPASISMTLDGIPVMSEYIPEMKMVVYTPPIPLASGNHQVALSVEDMANNQANKTWSFTVDATPPTTTATIDPASPNGLNGWYVSPVSVTLTAIDDEGGSGADKTEYSLNDGQSWSTYEIPLIVATQGENKILFHSMDKAGNQESPNKVITFKIYSLPPESPLIISPPDGVSLDSPVNVCGTAESMSLVKIYADGVETSATQADLAGNWQVSLNLTEESHVLSALAQDEAGNISTLTLSRNIFVRYQTKVLIDPGCQMSGQYSDLVSLGATLVSSQGPVAGKVAVFKLGTQEVTAISDMNGLAVATVTLDQPAGTYRLEVGFSGDDTYTSCSSAGSFTIEKEDIILTYLGDTIASTVGSVVLKAQFTDADSQAPVSNKPVSFSVGSQSLEAVTDTAGLATGILVINQPQGIYQAQAGFAGDDYYLSAISLPSYFVVFDPFSGQKVTGGGWLATGFGKANFGFNAEYKSGATVPTGEFHYKDHGTGLTVHSSGFSWLVFSGNSAILSGLATVNGIGGYTFRFEVSDLGEPGKNTDRFMISVMDSQGTEVYNIAGLINQGNIQVH